LEKAANNIAKKAIELALDPDYISPFSKAAQKYGIHLSGGKPDDITVLLARVSR
jgi:protein phosphatase PTC7